MWSASERSSLMVAVACSQGCLVGGEDDVPGPVRIVVCVAVVRGEEVTFGVSSKSLGEK